MYPNAPHLQNINTSNVTTALAGNYGTTQGRGTYQLHKYTRWPYWSTLNTEKGEGVQNLT